MFMTFSSGLMAGPAVSFRGSPTVSPVTDALCFSLLPVLAADRQAHPTIFLAHPSARSCT
jgi:hypothetical protein